MKTVYSGVINAQRRRILQAAPVLSIGTLIGKEASAAQRQTILSATDMHTLALWCEALVPTSNAAGIAAFVDGQLARKRDLACLTVRYLDWPGDYASFYRDGIAALNAAAQHLHNKDFAALDASQRGELPGLILGGKSGDWLGPPAGLFYFVTRSDAVDVVYGTVSGFARLGVPYRAHIAPRSSWPTA